MLSRLALGVASRRPAPTGTHVLANFLGRFETVDRVQAGTRFRADPPSSIRIGDVVRALEADQPIVECFRADGSACALAPSCRLRRMLKAVENAFLAALEEFSLEDCLSTDARRLIASLQPA